MITATKSYAMLYVSLCCVYMVVHKAVCELGQYETGFPITTVYGSPAEYYLKNSYRIGVEIKLWKIEIGSTNQQIEKTVGQRGHKKTYSRRRILASCVPAQTGCSDCDSYFTTCLSCDSGYWMNNVTCTDCNTIHPNCTKCDSAGTTCTNCTSPWIGDAILGCTCPDYNYKDANNVCKPCIANCKTCSDSTTCDVCEDLFSLPPDRLSCDICTPNCETCATSSTCSVCKVNYVLAGPGPNTCTTCAPGTYYSGTNTCSACHFTCPTCVDNSQKCTSCSPGRTFLANVYECAFSCPYGSFYNQPTDQCESCSNSYCEDCSYVSNSAAYCSVCKGGRWKDLTGGTNACEVSIQCPLGKYRHWYNRCYNVADPNLVSARFYGNLIISPVVENVLKPNYNGFVYLCKDQCGSCDGGVGLCTRCTDGFAVFDGNPQACQIQTFSAGLRNSTDGLVIPATDPLCELEIDVGNCAMCILKSYRLPSGLCAVSCNSTNILNPNSLTCEYVDPNCIDRNSLNLCLECANGYYYDATLRLCTPCHFSCLTCTDSTATSCTQCQHRYLMVATGTCKIMCRVGEYWDVGTSTCLTAHTMCLAGGLTSSTCSSCPTGKILETNGNCLLGVCNYSQYFDGTQCQPCHSSCLTCSGSTASSCLSCQWYQQLSGSPGTCSSYACPTECTNCFGSTANDCQDAVPDFYLGFANDPRPYIPLCSAAQYWNSITKTCDPCHFSCHSCDGPSATQCTVCKEGYFRLYDYCTNNPNGCNLYAGQSVDLIGGTQTCTGCTDPNCLSCSSASTCTYCKNGYYPVSGVCTQCASNTLYCLQHGSGRSLACEPGYVLTLNGNCRKYCSHGYMHNTNGDCLKCHSSCNTCYSRVNYCLSCLPGDIRNYIYCIINKDISQGAYYNNLVTGTIDRCISPCITCQSDGTSCLSCERGYYLSGTACLECDDSCFSCETTATKCTNCLIGYTWDPVAFKCDPICELSEYLDSVTNRCQRCPPPCFQCSAASPNTCTACFANSYLSGNTCLPCFENCRRCTGGLKNECTDCFRSYALVSGECVKQCGALTYLNESRNDCHMCHKFCGSCAGPTAYNCTSCKTGYTLQTNTFTTDNTGVTTGFCKKACVGNELYMGPFPNECRPCHASCDTCLSTSRYTCLTCSAGWFKQGSTCLKCHPFCSTCSGPSSFDCLTCPASSSLESITKFCKNTTACAVGETLDYGTNTCTSCESTCATCFNTTFRDCTTCSGSLLLLHNSTCIASCPTKTVYIGAPTLDCLACHTTCAECNGTTITSCTACPVSVPAQYIQLNASCLQGCGPNSYISPTNSTHCQICEATCLFCTGPDANHCTKCVTSGHYVQLDGTCSLGCSPNSFISPTNSTHCQPCHASCYYCSGSLSTQCTQCPLPNQYVQVGGTCATGCAAYSRILNSTHCQACHPTCYNCSGILQNQCTKCGVPGQYVQLNGTCMNGCGLASFISATSPDYCVPCNGVCKTCNGTTTTSCLSCYSGNYLQPDYGCATTCPAAYFKINGICATCHPNCLTCSGPLINDCLTCFSDRSLDPTGVCYKNCFDGFFMNKPTDSCEKCHSDCLLCTAGSAQDCSICANNFYKHVNSSCVETCPPTFYPGNATDCAPCSSACLHCSGPNDNECTACLENLVLDKSGMCVDACPEGEFPNDSNICSLCDSTCKNCNGPLSSNCLDCHNPETTRLSDGNSCVDCLTNPDSDPIVCSFSVMLSLEESSTTDANIKASSTIRVTFMNENSYVSRLSPIILKALLEVKVSGLLPTEYTYQIDIRKGRILIDFFFSKSLSDKSLVQVTPLTEIILRNQKTNAVELIFRKIPAILSIKVTQAPDSALLDSLTLSSEASEKLASSTSAISTVASVVVLVSSSGLGAPLMKMFRVFKLISRLRLINIEFGAYLELFLTFCSTVFKIGNDTIDLPALEASPNTRGKLTKYKVTVLTVRPMPLQYSIYFMLIVARIYRSKIRKYANKSNTLQQYDAILNNVAEAGRVMILTLMGIDVFFYSLHCIAHISMKGSFSMAEGISF